MSSRLARSLAFHRYRHTLCFIRHCSGSPPRGWPRWIMNYYPSPSCLASSHTANPTSSACSPNPRVTEGGSLSPRTRCICHQLGHQSPDGVIEIQSPIAMGSPHNKKKKTVASRIIDNTVYKADLCVIEAINIRIPVKCSCKSRVWNRALQTSWSLAIVGTIW